MRILILGESGECLAFIQKRTNSYRGEIKCFSLVYNFVSREVEADLFHGTISESEKEN